ncbi:MAG: hypothetical protein COB38_12275 [Gammaproteobacteria bacterium]|nr:MAG: hypothetical protein COB38_12275 [Gammaproteobacteria bacterium]
MNANQLFLLVSLCYLFAISAHCDAKEKQNSTLSILTLNLHTYQEISTAGKKESDLNRNDALKRVSDYDPIFNTIAKGIDELDPDIICLQEVGEWKENTAKTIKKTSEDIYSFGLDSSNAVNQLLTRIKSDKYSYYMDWSHYGWDVWKEGTAILSKYPILEKESRYISDTNNGTYSFWQSRKVTRVKVKTSDSKVINIFSVHSGWWDSEKEPFKSQFNRLMEWVHQIESKNEEIILCGDFNQPSNSKGYMQITNENDFVDTYLSTNRYGMLDLTVNINADGWKGNQNAKRIDYIFIEANSDFSVKRSERVFTSKKFGIVSDHVGIFTILTAHD